MAKKIFVAATMRNDGKTMLSLGLISALRKRNLRVGFIKPVGQRYLEIDGHKVDEDSILAKEVFNLDDALSDMSPLAIARGFTEDYIESGNYKPLRERIMDSYARVAAGKDFVVVEGTGHAGVGSVFDLSNATVAGMLGAKVVIVSQGGVGRPIDEISLSSALFKLEGVDVIGTVINKVLPAKYEKISHYLRLGLGRKNISLLGSLPYNDVLSNPTIDQIVEGLECEILSGSEVLNRMVKDFFIGAMTPHQALTVIKPGSLLIAPGDREDMLLAAMIKHNLSDEPMIAGILLTGGIMPHTSILDLLKKVNLPILATTMDTYKAASAINDLTVKIRGTDSVKIALAAEIIESYINVDALLDLLN
ncbi:MAG: AAA family ATPase [bacterium]|jgi:BioD-like phosphotransacetylase family protein|nr:AAA family ATPase [bacterium]MDD3804668.1 AAA family ATPase [bacterium]MDD4152910.1 AAA family ATPase [bacterium]MDD4557463.1 AAA family ATPase [bacterium]